MRDTKACRACLNTKDRLVRIPDAWYRMFETLAGVQASKSDGYPHYFCVECKSHIQKAITFRKKTRRAFYVLKEIMMVRKEVNLPDILTVDRNKVSLASSLAMFAPTRTAMFCLTTSEEGVTELTKEDLNMVNTSAVIDIKGEVAEFPIMAPESTVTAFGDDHAADMGDDGPYNGDLLIENPQFTCPLAEEKQPEPEQEPVEEIDMNDVFKGLKEPESEYSDEEPAEKPVQKKKKGKKGEKKPEKVKKEVNDYGAIMKARALLNYDVKELTTDEQKEVFKKRISNPKFTKALYTCGICVKVMPSADSLMTHFDIHMMKIGGAHLCVICKDKFLVAEDLELHSKENHLYQYTCKICQEDVYSLRDMVKHKKEKHINTKTAIREPIPDATLRFNVVDYEAELKDKFLLIPLSKEDKVAQFNKSKGVGKYVCEICGIGTPTSTQRTYHWQMHLRKPKNPETSCRVQCEVCGVWCWKQEALDKHMEAFHDYTYHCTMCDHEASNRYLAVDHLSRMHSEIIKCEFCGITPSTPAGLDAHIQFRHKPMLRNQHCTICGVGFIAQMSLYAHQFREHGYFKFPEPPSEGAENACIQCNVQFLSTKAYHNHLIKREHEEANDLPWKCLPCRKLFDSEADQRTHTAESCKYNKPTGVSYPSPCPQCGEMMPSYRRYYYHCQKQHPGVYLFGNGIKKLCDVCGKTYKSNKFPPHECKSEVTAKYKCGVCDIGFHGPNSVVFHVLKKHTKKPFSCTICHKTFRRRFDCKDHILKVHAPVKPYVCPICNRDFSHIDYLKKHAKDFHDVLVQLDIKIPKKKDFYVYPNMKVDLSLIDVNIVKDMKIKVADYTDQIFELIQDLSDYVITSDDVRKKVEEEGHSSKEFVIKKEDMKQEPKTSKRKTSAKSKKQARLDFVFGGDEKADEISDKPAITTKNTPAQKKTKKQAYRDFVFGIEEDSDEVSARTSQNIKTDRKKFIVINDYQEVQESVRNLQRCNQEYIVSEDGIRQHETLPRKPKDHRLFIIKGEDARRAGAAPPPKKIKYHNFEF